MTPKGLTLIELLVTVVVLTVGLSMVVSALTRGLKDSERLHTRLQQHYTAESTQLLQQALPRSAS